MAEVIGTLASVLTLLDYTFKFLSLISKFKDVPTVVRDLAEQTKQLAEVLKVIQSNSALEPNRDVLTSVLQSCKEDLSNFQKRLNSLAQGLDGGAIRKRWTAITAIVKEKEFQEAARRIEGHKTTLSLLLQSRSKADTLSIDLSNTRGGINDVAQGLPLIQNLALQIRTVSLNTESSVSKASNTLSSVEKSVENNTAELQALRDTMTQQYIHIKKLMTRPAALAQELNRFDRQGVVLTETNDDRNVSSSNAPLPTSLSVPESEPYNSKRMSSLRCTCFNRPQTTAWRSPYNVLGIGTLSVAQHRRDCPLSSFQRGFQTSIRYMFPRWLLNKAVDISFSTSYGAGGFSLAPYLGIISVTTNNNHAVNIFSKYLQKFDAESLEPLFMELHQLFRNGRASPFEIDRNGQNLIHKILNIAFNYCWDLELAIELVRFLKGSGTNIDSVDFSGCSALAMFLRHGIESPHMGLQSHSKFQSAREALLKIGNSVVANADSSNLTVCRDPNNLSRFAKEMIQNLRASDKFAEGDEVMSGSFIAIMLRVILDVLKCGLLSMAVLQRSETLVRQQLQDPAAFNEKNAAGQTPLHLCGDWAKGIEILLEAGFLSDKIDNSHLTSLDYTISTQGSADAVTILLKAGSPFTCCDSPHGWNSTWDRVLYDPLNAEMENKYQWPLSPKVSCLIENIKYRRESLSVLAETHLSPNCLRKISTLGTAMDDTRAHYTWKALKKAGVNVPSSLSTHGVSVYHQVRSESLAKHLYDMGFKNMDECDQHGRTPLMTLACRFEETSLYTCDIETLDLAKWFLLQGADPLRSFQDCDINTIHIAAYYGTIRTAITTPQEQQRLIFRVTGDFFKRQWIDPVVLKESKKLESFPFGIRILNPLLLIFVQEVSLDCYDICRCGCSHYGCTPTTALLKGVIGSHSDWRHNSLDLYWISALLYNWYSALAAVNLSVDNVKEEVRRFVAFEKLDLQHTCCRLNSSRCEEDFELRISSKEHVDLIREEEEELLNQLEKMLLEVDSDWWNLSSILDILLDVMDDEPPPALRWANLWLISRTYGLGEEACEEIRIAAGISRKDFWESAWEFPKLGNNRKFGWKKISSKAQLEDTKRDIPRAYLRHELYRKITHVWVEFRS